MAPAPDDAAPDDAAPNEAAPSVRFDRRDGVLVAVVTLLLLTAAVARPLWRALDPRIQVTAAGERWLDAVGVCLDPWGGAVVDPRAGPVVDPVAVPLGDGTFEFRSSLTVSGSYYDGRQTRPRALHEKVVAELRARHELIDASEASAALAEAIRLAEANVAQAPNTLPAPAGALPYRYARAAGAFGVRFAPYSLGPNRRDEYGHGDDVVYLDRYTPLWEVYEEWSWSLPLLGGLALLAVVILGRLLPVGRTPGREAGRSLGIALLTLLGVQAVSWLADADWRLSSEVAALLLGPWHVDAIVSPRYLVFVYLALACGLSALFLRLPRVPDAPPPPEAAVSALPARPNAGFDALVVLMLGLLIVPLLLAVVALLLS